MGLKRRTFLQFLAGGALGTIATPILWKGLDDVSIWTQNFPWIPRIPKGPIEYTDVLSKFCPSFSGSSIGMANGNPVCVSGNKNNPFSLGAVSSFAGTEVQMLYSSSRIQEPMARTEKGLEPISWDEALTLLSKKITEAKSSVAMISGDDTSSVNEVFSAILKNSNSKDYYFMPSERQPAQQAFSLLGGSGLVTYQYDTADMIVAIGANVVDNWGLPIRFVKLREQSQAKLLYIGSMANNTFSVADSTLPILPGTEVLFLIGVVSSLLKQGYALPPMQGIETLQTFIQRYKMGEIIKETGIKKEVFEAFVLQLKNAKAPLLLAGSAINSGTPVATVLLSMLITTMLNKNGTSPLGTVPFPKQLVKDSLPYTELVQNDLISYLNSISEKKPLSLMLTYNANPLYALPGTKNIQKNWEHIDFTVAISAFMDETTLQSDLVLPLPLSIETIDDAYTPYGSDKQYYMQTTKLLAPIYASRSGMDIAFAVAKSLNIPFGFASSEELLAQKAQAYKAESTPELATLWSSIAKPAILTTFDASPLQAFFSAIPIKPRSPNGANNDMYLLPYTELYMGMPTTSIPPFNVKQIPHTVFKDKKMHVMMNAKTASKLFRTGDTLRISSKEDSVVATLYLHEGIVDNAIALLAGMGHTAFDSFTKNKGVNAMNILSVENISSPVFSSWSRNIVEITKI